MGQRGSEEAWPASLCKALARWTPGDADEEDKYSTSEDEGKYSDAEEEEQNSDEEED